MTELIETSKRQELQKISQRIMAGGTKSAIQFLREITADLENGARFGPDLLYILQPVLAEAPRQLRERFDAAVAAGAKARGKEK